MDKKMNEENSKNMFLPTLFGIMGITLLILAWLIPADASDRIIAAAIGSAGLFTAIIRLPALNRSEKAETGPLPENTESEEKS